MTQTEALRLALEALSTSMYPQPRQLNAIAAIKSALEAKDEPFDDGYCQACEGELCTAKKGCVALDNPQPQAKDEPVAIKWEKDADKECRYNNWVGMTPFGRILITWKGWKEWHDACVDEFPGGFEAYGLPDDVKAACEVEYLRRLYTTPPQRKPLTDAQSERLYRNIEPSRQQDARSLAAFKRLLRVIEAAHGIKGKA